MLIYALFPQVGLKFLENRGNPDAFEPAPGCEPEPTSAPAAPPQPGGPETYTVTVNGKRYVVQVEEGGDVSALAPVAANAPVDVAAAAPAAGVPLPAPLAGNVLKVNVMPGDAVAAGDVVMLLEAMKMETEVRATADGTVTSVDAKVGDVVTVGQSLLTLG